MSLERKESASGSACRNRRGALLACAGGALSSSLLAVAGIFYAVFAGLYFGDLAGLL